MKVVSITHSNDGIRVAWPDGTSRVFANAVYLAESYVVAMCNKEECRRSLIEDISTTINRLADLVERDATQGEVMREIKQLRDDLAHVVTQATE